MDTYGEHDEGASEKRNRHEFEIQAHSANKIPTEVRILGETWGFLLLGIGLVGIPQFCRQSMFDSEYTIKSIPLYICTAIGGGVLGGAARRLRDHVTGTPSRYNRLLPAYGGLIGFLFLLIFYIAPSWLGCVRVSYDPLFLALMCGLSAMFHERTWSTVEAFFGKHQSDD